MIGADELERADGHRTHARVEAALDSRRGPAEQPEHDPHRDRENRQRGERVQQAAHQALARPHLAIGAHRLLDALQQDLREEVLGETFELGVRRGHREDEPAPAPDLDAVRGLEGCEALGGDAGIGGEPFDAGGDLLRAARGGVAGRAAQAEELGAVDHDRRRRDLGVEGRRELRRLLRGQSPAGEGQAQQDADDPPSQAHLGSPAALPAPPWGRGPGTTSSRRVRRRPRRPACRPR